MNQQELEQKLSELKGEIFLAEKELQELQLDIERHQQSKGIALLEYTQQVKNKMDEVLAFDERIKEQVQLIDNKNTTIIDLYKDIEELATNRTILIATTEDAVKSIYNEAEKREDAVLDRENNVSGREIEATLREQEVVKGRLEVDRGLIENENTLQLLDNRNQELYNREEKSKQTLAQNKELLDDIARQLEEKRMEVQRLDVTINVKTIEANKIGVEAEGKLKTAISLQSRLEAKEVLLNEKEKELITKELWLADREATVGRAYRETLDRGGKIN